MDSFSKILENSVTNHCVFFEVIPGWKSLTFTNVILEFRIFSGWKTTQNHQNPMDLFYPVILRILNPRLLGPRSLEHSCHGINNARSFHIASMGIAKHGLPRRDPRSYPITTNTTWNNKAIFLGSWLSQPNPSPSN